jgi:hypothetical protein
VGKEDASVQEMSPEDPTTDLNTYIITRAVPSSYTIKPNIIVHGLSLVCKQAD